MRKIRIKQLYQADKKSSYSPNRLHRINITPENTVYFSNILKARDFIAQLNRFLNIKTLELNNIYVDLFTHYRNVAVIYNDKLKNNALKSFIPIIDRQFDELAIRTSEENYNSIVIKKFINLIETMFEFSVSLSEILKDNKKYYNAYQFDIIIGRLSDTLATINNFGDPLPGEKISKRVKQQIERDNANKSYLANN